MLEKEFRARLQKRGLNEKKIDFAIKAVKEFEAYLEAKKAPFESASLDALKDYVSLLIKKFAGQAGRYCSLLQLRKEKRLCRLSCVALWS
jgi:hypothetical protein